MTDFLCRLWLDTNALAAMTELANQFSPYETGGMLLGYKAGEGEAVVTGIIGPGPGAKHGRFRFSPDSEYQQAALNERFWVSNGQETYLGDWHTHPHGVASLSWLDKRTLARIACTPSSQIEHPAMLVLAGFEDDWSVGAFRFESTKRRFLIREFSISSMTVTTFSQ